MTWVKCCVMLDGGSFSRKVLGTMRPHHNLDLKPQIHVPVICLKLEHLTEHSDLETGFPIDV